MRVNWHSYRYFPYEHELAARELKSMLGHFDVGHVEGGLELMRVPANAPLDRLTYFSSYVNGHGIEETIQSRLEKKARSGKCRQATRYSVHGLHEYKGKFNPQVARAILNMFGIGTGANVLDPFCGSGTTLVECAHSGATGFGTDLNPFAVFLANVKLQMLRTPEALLRKAHKRLSSSRERKSPLKLSDNERTAYLRSWFDEPILYAIEELLYRVREAAGEHAPIFLAIASNLLRDYSRQEPCDLRIRRRMSPMPSISFGGAFQAACEQAFNRLADVQAVLGQCTGNGLAVVQDVRLVKPSCVGAKFDAAVTSPPYAMALPYIDTQRLSLVWLELVPASQILSLEAELIGSREFRGAARATLNNRLIDNEDGLPAKEVDFCNKLLRALGPEDGFRRVAVPPLLYRYFADMHKSFAAVKKLLRSNAPFALIVGHNRTTLSGRRYDIDTPRHLSNLAQDVGWEVVEHIPLQTYHRYGLHAENAVEAEMLLILRNSECSPRRRKSRR